MVGEMFEDLPRNHYAEVSHMREIALPLMARQVDLGKENFSRLPFERSPDFDFSLQRAQLPFLKLSLMLPAQMIKDRLGLDRRVAFKQLLNLRPVFGEGVRPSAITARLFRLTRKLTGLAPFTSRLLVHPSFGRSFGQRISRL
jgi:hypothetical protein